MIAGPLAHNHPLYVALVAVHVVLAVGGFGAVAISGAYGVTAGHPERPGSIAEARRYFASAGWPEWVVLAVPFVGLAALAVRPGPSQLGRGWVTAAFGVWFVAAVVLVRVVRPAERRLRTALAPPDAADDPAAWTELRRAGPRLTWGSLIVDGAFAAALLLMIFQP